MPVPFLAVIVAPMLVAAPVQRDAAGVSAFLKGIYAGYAKDSHGARIGEPERYFEPRLAAAIRKDADESERSGDIGKMDADPFCHCQDFDAIVPKITVLHVTGNAASASVRFDNFGTPVVLRYDLVWTAKGWRIFEIGYPEDGSLRAMFL